MNTLYLVRHGENPANITKEFSHRRVDYPLTLKGVLQATQTAAYLKGFPIDEVYSSPLLRAVQTAQIIAEEHGLEVRTLEEFREVDAGTLEDEPPTDENWRLYMSVVRDWYEGKPESRFPGGENYFEVARRAQAGISRVVSGKEDRNIVVVGHGGIFSVGITSLCATDQLGVMRNSPYQNCAVSRLSAAFHEDTLVVSLDDWNYCSHLTGEAADLVSAIPEALIRHE